MGQFGTEEYVQSSSFYLHAIIQLLLVHQLIPD